MSDGKSNEVRDQFIRALRLARVAHTNVGQPEQIGSIENHIVWRATAVLGDRETVWAIWSEPPGPAREYIVSLLYDQDLDEFGIVDEMGEKFDLAEWTDLRERVWSVSKHVEADMKNFCRHMLARGSGCGYRIVHVPRGCGRRWRCPFGVMVGASDGQEIGYSYMLSVDAESGIVSRSHSR